MRFFVFWVFGFALLCSTAYGQQKMRAQLTYTTFDSPGGKAYVEVHLSVDAATVKYAAKENGVFQASIQVLYEFKQDGKVKNIDKFKLESPAIEDTTGIDFRFLNQQRYALDNGKYEFHINIKDVNDAGQPGFDGVVPLKINYEPGKIAVSGIELVEDIVNTGKDDEWYKYGLQIKPHFTSYYPASVKKLNFYAEIYNTDQSGAKDFLVRYYIKDKDNNKIVPELSKFEKIKADRINLIFNQFNISQLPSGNYSLVIEVRDRENTLVGFNAIDITRSNPPMDKKQSLLSAQHFARQYTDIDELTERILSLSPLATESEYYTIKALVKSRKLKKMQDFLYEFWFLRYGLDAENQYNMYAEKVDFTNQHFSTQVHKGYETDRGYVYLKYGEPNTRDVHVDSPGEYPYEVWHYYKIPSGEKDIIFVFLALERGNNNYYQIHSTARGEISNPSWKNMLQTGFMTTTIKSLEEQDMRDRHKIIQDQPWGSDAGKEW